MTKLLFVCSGNSCRSPMAMAIARYVLGDQVKCDSAAGNLKNGQFQASKTVASKAVEAIRKLCNGKVSISSYRPKPLDENLVKDADWVLFLGEKFWDNGKSKFPSFTSSMTYYCSYISKITRKESIEVPDPFDGQSWPDYYGTGTNWPGKDQRSYDMVAQSMLNDFQPSLSKRLGLS